jgi:hypothetical protein
VFLSHLKNCGCFPGDQVSDSAGIPRPFFTHEASKGCRNLPRGKVLRLGSARDVLVTRISGGVISGPAINGRDEMVYGGGPRRKRSIFDDGRKQSKAPRRKIFK